MPTLNFRKHYHLYLSNTKDNGPGAGPYALKMPANPTFRGTLRQIVDEVNEFQRKSGGCFVSARIVDPATGEAVPLEEVRSELFLRQFDK